ncbi:MAG: DUF1080 domain-containing protein [Verrucomicrobiota bacterium]
MKQIRNPLVTLIFSGLILPGLTWAADQPADAEPKLPEAETIQLIQANTLDGWKVPSDLWSIQDGVITGETGTKPPTASEWLYTEQRFADFIFTCEVRLTGEHRPNSGIYFRVNPIQFTSRNGKNTFEAASGYEFDVVPGKFNGSLGDWYARPKLRIFADAEIINRVFRTNDWNRMTIRARGNRLEYWLNGEKIIDYVDEDPNGSREGFIGLQIHDHSIMKVQMRHARIAPIPIE